MVIITVAVLSACGDTRKPMPPGVEGILPIDASTEYVFLHKPTTVRGACAGWKTISIQKPNQPETGMTNLMCWKESDGQLLTATFEKVSPKVAPMAVIH
ncbi:hypothetical protein [Variovorax sp. KBW07]|uniref:hypothetical protein n=1 Tax=Variovorax sp. KBW07 TaxID=2153358 RepID=UPI000F56DE9C|nr:hypothetical protein [Variovorax sp. KBW07]